MSDFISGRSQVVRVGTSESDAAALHFGVPQGSVLGPKRFLESVSYTHLTLPTNREV